MKILLTGGGTGGHFYPLIAIAEKLNELASREKIVTLKLYYMSDAPYDKRMLFENGITYVQIPAGKMRTYRSIKNLLDMFKTVTGAFFGLLSMFFIYPDVVISKGGYASFPAVFAAKLLRIPVVLHESDSYPGRLNLWTSKFATHVAVSWAEAAEYLPKNKTVLTGQPIRRDLLKTNPDGAYEALKLVSNLPVILVLGGSLGAEFINNAILEVLPEMLSRYQVVHQTGTKNYADVVSRAHVVMDNNPYLGRYVVIPYLTNLTTRQAAGIASLIITRAGSALFEIATWGVPSIVIPITNSNGDHQRKNAFNYARTNSCIVIEEANMTPHVLMAEVDKLMNDQEKLSAMHDNALRFSQPDAAEKIARVALDIALSHISD